MDSPRDNRNPPLQKYFDDIRNECIPAIEAATVPILDLPNVTFKHDRSGVLYRVGDHHFIVTAAHGLREIVGREILLCVSMNAHERLPIPLDNEARFHGTEVEGRDIAVIRLPDDTARQVAVHKRFISHNEVLAEDDERTGWYVIVGFPGAWSPRKLGKDFLYSRPLIYSCRAYTDYAKPPSWYRRDVHLLLGFELNAENVTDGRAEKLPGPYGISGCGVWRVADRSKRGMETVSKHNVSLVAIENNWCETRGYIMATRINWVLNRIIDDYPDVERSMRLTYPRNIPSGRIIVGQQLGNWVPQRSGFWRTPVVRKSRRSR